jgi:predicted Rossmann fold nucleotide-binding protein DprA/Smf involved in DNA uptake
VIVLERHAVALNPDDPRYPAALLDQPNRAPFWAAGALDVLATPAMGFFCSSQCPGAIILKTFDAITALRDRGQIVIGGFHSPMEWGCLEILLRGRQPVIWVPARSIEGMRLKPELQPAFSAGRLLILSPFMLKHRRITADLADRRNRFVAALASEVFVAHAAPSSRTFVLCKELAGQGKPLITVDDPANGNLLGMSGVRGLPQF